MCGKLSLPLISVVIHFSFQPDRNWEIDLVQLESLIDQNTAAILINNPSNPTGSVFSKTHLLDILKVAEKHHIPIISDEIYGGMVFEGNTFYPLASLSERVPILTVGGLAKIYLVPGWRVGWVIVHDRNDLMKEVRTGLVKLSQLILGANTIGQSIIEEALDNTPPSFHKQLNATLQEHAFYLSERLAAIPSLHVIKPGGAMYMMVSKFQNYDFIS
jgi:tyrosine aminotransferase